jgi:hypothetical protein
MTAKVDIVNRALQALGTRTTVTAAELAGNTTNEAIQANLSYVSARNSLLRMAPWNCAFNTASLNFITSAPGTPENTSPATTLWQKGQPAPPWAYEYQYPVDCLLLCWITPQTATGFAGGVPISTAVTGGAPSFWQGPPVRYKVAVDQFYGVTGIAIGATGLNYGPGEIITLIAGPTTSPPIGAPLQIQVDTVDGSGAILTYHYLNQILGEGVAVGGSYFAKQSGPQPQGSSTGTGTGATFNLFQTLGDQRIILTNQEFAIANYIKQVTDENLFDDLFQNAFCNILGAWLCLALTGDKVRANAAVAEANRSIALARRQDGNEGMVVNDVTPDWLRARGIAFSEGYSGPFDTGFDWGQMWPGYT